MPRLERIHEQINRLAKEKIDDAFDELTTRLDLILKRAKMDSYDKRDMIAELEELLDDIG